MITSKTKNYTVHHNGDFSGEVIFMIKPLHVDEGFDGSSDYPTPSHYEVSLEFEDLRELVFMYLRNKMVGTIESIEDDEFEAIFFSLIRD